MKKWLKKLGSSFTKKKNDVQNISQLKETVPNDQNVLETASEPIPNDQNIPNAESKISSDKNWFHKLGKNFKNTSLNIKKAIFSKKIDQSTLEVLEEALLLSDLGIIHTELLINELRQKKLNTSNIHNYVSTFLKNQFSLVDHKLILKPEKKLRVILLFGVNGSGKTTTIAKLANLAQNENLKVLLAAADTFRAAAKEQIEKWGNSIQVEVLSGSTGEDPSSVVFKAHKKAIDEKFDLLIIDTAGRLHNKVELMEELKKMTRIIKKTDQEAPHNKILVLDSTIGQNTYNQIDSFNQHIGITGIIMTKLDGSAKGGSLIGITKKYNLPIHAIGVGEKIDDLFPFIPKDFVNALLGEHIGEEQ